MKKMFFYLSAMIFWVFVISEVSFSQVMLPYDDFAGPRIDKRKWMHGEGVREIREDRLLFKVTSPNPGIANYPYFENNDINFINPNSVNSIQADVAILEGEIINVAETRARLTGRWFSSTRTAPDLTGDRTGDVNAEVSLVEGSGGLEAQCLTLKITNFEGTTAEVIDSRVFQTPIIRGTTYTLFIGYDAGTNVFTFKVGNETFTLAVGEGSVNPLPARLGPPNRPGKVLSARIKVDDSGSSGYLSAAFDNVFKNGVLYEDFSSPTIDSSKWNNYELVREISGGALRSKIRSSVATGFRIYDRLEVAFPSLIHAIEVKATPTLYVNNQAADSVTRIAGYYYNDGSGPEGSTRAGQVGGQIQIGGNGTTPVARWLMWRETEESGDFPETLAMQTFATPITLGATYTLFLGWDGTQITFKINDELAHYTPTGPINPSKIKWKEISTRIWNANGKEAVVESLLDDVRINEFNDVDSQYWAYQYVMAILNDGVTLGCGAGMYCPGNDVTREQMASFIVRAVDGIDATTCLGNIFNDVPQGAPHCANIERLAQLNVTLGCAGGMYCPLGNVTREQMASFIVRAVDRADATQCIGTVFTDVPQGTPHCANIERLAELNVTQGCMAGMYCPSHNVLRDQMAAFLARAFLGTL